MVDIVKTMGLAVLVFHILLFSGCESYRDKQQSRNKEIEKTPAEIDKARLLKKIDLRYENPKTHYQLGQLYQLDGLWDKAEHEYGLALSFDPVHRDAQAARVKVSLQSGDEAKSALLTDIYIQQASSSAMSSLRLGLAFQRQRLDEYALQCYKQALRLAPSSARINRQIGYYYLSKNNKQRAMDYLSRSFQLDSNQPDVAGELGRLGVAVKIPRKTTKRTKKLDAEVKSYDKELRNEN